VNEERIARIVEAVVKKLEQGTTPVVKQSFTPIGGRGVHPTVDAAAKAARKAFLELSDISLADRKRYIEALRAVTHQ
jgi:acyl-CoA reductase-like NAD-dependent aldehyde dehydrogenase